MSHRPANRAVALYCGEVSVWTRSKLSQRADLLGSVGHKQNSAVSLGFRVEQCRPRADLRTKLQHCSAATLKQSFGTSSSMGRRNKVESADKDSARRKRHTHSESQRLQKRGRHLQVFRQVTIAEILN